MPGIELPNGGITNNVARVVLPKGTLNPNDDVVFLIQQPMDRVLGQPNPFARIESLLNTLAMEQVYLLDLQVQQRNMQEQLQQLMAQVMGVMTALAANLQSLPQNREERRHPDKIVNLRPDQHKNRGG